MPEININGIQVNFPFEPYKVQYDYMEKVLECLKNRENGVLESPTGTGKTLSLLCSTLAWLLVRKAQLQASAQGLMTFETPEGDFVTALRGNLEKTAGKENPSTWSNMMCSPKIIYASRTHSQITQVMAELKRSSYSHVKVAVLGSRDQLCIHPEVMKESSSSAKIMGCQVRVSSRSCHFYNNVENKKSDPVFSEGIMDIEDLVKLSKNMQCCPYYLSRELQQTADIIFMPYNYLLDVRTRKSLDVQLMNSVIILDEGHNVEKMCEEAASMEISSTDIAVCISEITHVMRNVHDQLAASSSDGTQEQVKDFTLDDLCVLKTLFLELEKIVQDITLDTVSGQKVGKTFKGSYIFELLAKAEIKEDKWMIIVDIMFKVAQHLQTTSESAMSKKGHGLQKFSDFLRVVFTSKGNKNSVEQTDASYKVYIEPEIKKSHSNAWSSAPKTTVTGSTNAKVINFWCFSPGFGMRSLLEQGVHSIIITSGTLSPLQATIQELGIPINVQLENPHIIKSNQICVTIVKRGPGNEDLKSSYENRDRPEYLRDLGQTLLNFSRKIPDGFLVFFPSYQALTTSVNHWQLSGQWSKIAEIKPIYVEPKDKEHLSNIMNEYYGSVKDGNSRGAILLAVCRGKVSEGLDFADARGRAVMVTGLPYPPYKNPRVMLKREYIDQNRKSGQSLTGNQWYELEATRAVNQAIGRVIRHANDYGSIILCDSRFDKPRTINILSAWLRPYVCPCNSFGQAFGKVTAFFRNIGDLMPVKNSSSEGGSFDYATEVKTRTLQAKKEDEENKNKERTIKFKAFLEQMKSETQPTKNTPLSGSQGLLDALNKSQQPKTIYNPLKATAPEHKPTEDEIEPTIKRRKLKLVPLKFGNTEECPDPAAGKSEKGPTKEIEHYLIEVKQTLDGLKYSQFQTTVRNYKKEDNYSDMVKSLTQVFSSKESRHLLPGFQRFVKGKDKPRFETFCNTVFKS